MYFVGVINLGVSAEIMDGDRQQRVFWEIRVVDALLDSYLYLNYLKKNQSTIIVVVFVLFCFVLFCFPYFCRFCLVVFLFLMLSLELFVDVSLIFSCPADQVPDWQPRILLGMVETRSVNAKKTHTHTHTTHTVC